MDEPEDNMSADDSTMDSTSTGGKPKPKKRSLVERELETTLTARVTSPITNGGGSSTSRYGRARRLKTDNDFCDTEKVVTNILKSPKVERTPVKSPSPAYKMHASNSPIKPESPKVISLERNLENQIENIYNANMSLSRFSSEDKNNISPSPAKKFSKVYIRKDLIQTKEKEKEETITLIKNIFSPVRSKSNSHLNIVLERSSEKYNLNGNISKPQNGYLDTSSVVKTLDFDGNKKKKKESTEVKTTLSKSDLFDLEAKCAYQVGDLAWARMGTYPFWPCIVTREPGSDMFVRKKLFGRIERDMIHVTFFGDNGRRSWILETMLRKFQGLGEFEAARDLFTPEARKKDPRLYAAFFISDKKLALWHTSIEEADILLREPKRLRIDIFYDMLGRPRVNTPKMTPKTQKSGKITRTDSDVSLSESLFDTLFSEDDVKNDDSERSRHKSRNKSLDVSEVVTACLDNMAAKSGMTKIQKQSHMDRWLQKAKSKTPEKSHINISISVERLEQEAMDKNVTEKESVKTNEAVSTKKKKRFSKEGPVQKPYSFRKSTTESQTLLSHHNEHDYSKTDKKTMPSADQNTSNVNKSDNSICIIDKVESLQDAATENHDPGVDTKEETPINTDITQDEAITKNNKNINITEDFINQFSQDSNIKDDINSPTQNSVINENMDVSCCESDLQINVPNSEGKSKVIVEEIDRVETPCIADDSDKFVIAMETDIIETETNNQSTPNIIIEPIANQNFPIVETEKDDQIGQDEINSNVDNNMSLDEDVLSSDNNEIIETINVEVNEQFTTKSDESLEKVSNNKDNSQEQIIDTKVLVKQNQISTTVLEVDIHQDVEKVNESNDIPHDAAKVSESIETRNENIMNEDAFEYNEVISGADVDDDNKEMIIKTKVKEKDLDFKEAESISTVQKNTDKSYVTLEGEQAILNGDISLECADDDGSDVVSVENKIDNISLSSVSVTEKNCMEPTVSYKGIDPETASLNSLSSEISNTSELLPKIATASSLSEGENTDVTNKQLRKIKDALLLDSDTESMSSLDDITLSELKLRAAAADKPELVHADDTLDSVKSEISNATKNLRLVLTDCFLEPREDLPVIKEVSSNTNVEIEIMDSHNSSETNNSFKKRKLRLRKSVSPTEAKINGLPDIKDPSPERTVTKIKEEPDVDTISIHSSDSGASIKRRGRKEKQDAERMKDPEFLKYVEMRQDALMDEHPELTQDEIIAYLYKTWQYEENLKSDQKKSDDIEQSNLVKGVCQDPPKKKKVFKMKKLIDINKIMAKEAKKSPSKAELEDLKPRELPKRRSTKAFYKEDFSDIEDEIQLFEIFKSKKKDTSSKTDVYKQEPSSCNNEKINSPSETKVDYTEIENKESKNVIEISDQEENLDEFYDEEELYFEQLTKPKPNIFKGLVREKVCEICETTSNLVKCKGCNGMFHVECVNKVTEVIEVPAPTRGRKKKKKPRGRRPKMSTDSNGDESHSDEKSQDANVSEENMSLEDIKDPEPIVIPDADNFEAQLEAKMKEMIENVDKVEYDLFSSDDGLDWSDTIAGKCEIVDVKLKTKQQPELVDYSDFKCKNCQKYDIPICFVCKASVSPKGKVERRQKCQVAHCHKYYHLECLDHWPQTQFTSGEPSRNNKKIDEHFEAITCPRHVCHTCVCDDPRGCKTRFSGDKLARCVRCPATYHSFTKCLPAGSQILSASHIVCPRHYEHRPGKVPCHVNTGWCFICALGGTLICCEYCPTSFHADCLNIEPPEGGYMCEDCETGRLPLYGEMVWVKLGHYRWWPGIVLHPSEIPDNIMAVKHSPGEFVVRFFGQYDHYWVNRGRVFPFQEGDSGRISGQKSKIDEAFTKAMEHAQRAFEILKNIEPNDEENQDIASSLLPPHYVKLKVNRPCGSLYGRKVDIEESSLTQCECNPDEEEPCGPYSHCLNRMLLTECGPTCRAGELCQNRAFEKRQYPKLVPYRTPHRGWGLKTLEDVKAGQFVIEYVGELIDEEEFRRRMRRKHEMRDENFYFLTLDKERMIDAGPKGNLARFMNHCCEPNCETQKWTVLGDVRVGLFAIHDIPANTEVTFNYNLECAGIEKKQCMCGAKRCSGYIGAKPKQDEPQPKKGKPGQPAKRPYKKRKNTVESPSTSKVNKPKRPVGRPAKPRELTDIEKDLLIIKNATNGLSSDSEGSGRLSSVESDKKDAKALKRKRVSFSTEEIIIYNGSSSPSVKRMKLDEDKSSEVGD